MGLLTGIAVYLVVWWLVLFMVLPWGVRGVDTSDVAKGHASGAPKKPRMLLKAAATTIIAAIVWYGLYLLAESDWVSFRE